MKKLFILFLFCTPSLSGFTQSISNTGPEAAGFSAERLKRLDQAMNEWVEKGYMNGAAALIIRDGKVAYYKATGYNDLDTRAPRLKEAK